MKLTQFARAVCGACLMTGASSALALDVSFADFADLSGFRLNERAASIGNPVTDDQGRKVLRLTDNYGQKGSAFLSTSASLAGDASFHSFFQFRMTVGDGFIEAGEGAIKGADGIVFAVHTVNDYTGPAGESLGFAGMYFGAGVEFDTFNNGTHVDKDGNHVGINLDGSVASVIARAVTPVFNNGQVWSAWVDYDGVSDVLDVRVAEGGSATRPVDPFISYGVDLNAKVLGQAVYFGFTAATGSLRNHQDILRWEVATVPAPVPVPAPLVLFGSAALTLAFKTRKSPR